MRTTARLAGLVVILSATAGSRADPVSLDVWFQGPRVTNVSISPDARYLSLVVSDGEQSYVAVKDRGTREPAKPVFATDPAQDVKPQSCGWVSAKRLVCRFSGYTGKHGSGDWVSRLVAFDADGGNRKNLLVSTTSFSPVRSTDNLNVVSWRADEPDTLLVQGYFPGSNGYAVGRLNADTSALKIVAKPQDRVFVFQDDGAGNVLFAGGAPQTYSRERKLLLFGRKSNDDKWRQLTRLGAHAGDPHVALLKVIPGTTTAYAVMAHEGHTALFKVDLTDAKDPEPVFWHTERDIARSIVGSRAKLLGVAFESSLLGPQYLDERMAALDSALRKNWPNRWNWVESNSDDEKVFVIRTSSASEPSGFFVLDTSQAGVKFDAIGFEWPGFAKAQLPVSKPIGIQTRAGHLEEALFTPAPDTGRKTPLVVFADGAQLTGGFEPATYFLVSRGYAVLRPYFTGSTLDADLQHRPYLDWNGALYDELIDAARWAAQQPGIDPERVCIVGRNNYGGYQALLAAARADNPFKCAASLEGLSDLEKPRKEVERRDTIGEFKPEGPSDEQVQKESPLGRAAQFRMPVLLIEGDTSTHSARDDEGGREMAAALVAAGKPHQLQLIKEIDEQYLRAEYAELEKFLAANLH
jgi:dipeptidyl aminopeptidase/acylaminoacyl peptidase